MPGIPKPRGESPFQASPARLLQVCSSPNTRPPSSQSSSGPPSGRRGVRTSGAREPPARRRSRTSHRALPSRGRGLLPRRQPLLRAATLTASWGWCPTPARREWPRAPPRPPARLSALCTHGHSEPPGAGPADGPREPAASARRGPGPGPGPLQNRSPRSRPRPPRLLQPPPPPPPPWLPPCAAVRDRWARVKGHSERRPARPFAAAHPGSHRGRLGGGCHAPGAAHSQLPPTRPARLRGHASDRVHLPRR